ncbi:hypothetical protein BCR34DRAFT_604514 [Clohesyomyces aquaticus]|uniref:DUF7730 domain-containing protein n=1 Tax=Clohesyomyces aquaticus TaxID=1231657 RepID=A0A1Y1Z5B1_9PLEO|nr:hypothetical protein BCR34DRAFT_604514 [Clohesyomyces aquaticus]
MSISTLPPPVPILPPQNLQLQSPLLRLPTELKHLIFTYCFFSPSAILNPGALTALLLTCRRLYHECSPALLYTSNTFAFTTVDTLSRFLRTIGPSHTSLIQSIQIDARGVSLANPGLVREWLQYLSFASGPWAKVLGSLREDVPRLRCLRLDFSQYWMIGMVRHELWEFLRGLLANVEGLERIVVIGAGRGRGMARYEPWSPVHFVGGDGITVGEKDLVERMWRGVQGEEGGKVIRWERDAGKGTIYLEVVTKAYLVKHVDRRWSGTCTRRSHKDVWPENGSCTWYAYRNRNSDVMTEPTMRSTGSSTGSGAVG